MSLETASTLEIFLTNRVSPVKEEQSLGFELGQLVDIYSRPITKRGYQGEAVIVELGEAIEEIPCLFRRRCKVKFLENGQIKVRSLFEWSMRSRHGRRTVPL